MGEYMREICNTISSMFWWFGIDGIAVQRPLTLHGYGNTRVVIEQLS